MPVDDQERAHRKLKFEFGHKRGRRKSIFLIFETEAFVAHCISGEFTSEQFVEAGLKRYLPRIRPH